MTATGGAPVTVAPAGSGGVDPDWQPRAVAVAQVTATIAQTLSVSVENPAPVFPELLPGQSAEVSERVAVKSNSPTGYRLTVTRTAFTGGELPLAIRSAAVAAPMALDIAADTPIAIPVGTGLGVGRHTGGDTGAAGD